MRRGAARWRRRAHPRAQPGVDGEHDPQPPAGALSETFEHLEVGLAGQPDAEIVDLLGERGQPGRVQRIAEGVCDEQGPHARGQHGLGLA